MCGIFFYRGTNHTLSSLQAGIESVSSRGPDKTVTLIKNDTIMAFHRLSIMDTSDNGSQPMPHPMDNDIVLMCNGEIYNHIELIKKYNLKDYRSKSDCEVILWLYKLIGIEKTLHELDGVFSFVIIDKSNIIVARDPFGVRPLFYNFNKDIYVSSVLKGISNYTKNTGQFPPGHYWESNTNNTVRWYSNRYKMTLFPTDEEYIITNIRNLFEKAVEKRMQSHREVGCLLSGGLDSSLVAALVSRNMKGAKLKTFSIGLKGAEDLKYARLVADHIGSDHHEVIVTEQEMIDAIPEVIKTIESMDTTTVRASVPNYLVSKYIKENTDCKVIFQGDGADEVCGSYIYLNNAPNPASFHGECMSLLNNIHMFDVLRADRTISCWGLEPRTPFLDKIFVNYYMSIYTPLKLHSHGNIEKYLLRKAFEDSNQLPKEVLYRKKEALSDGCSSKTNSWHTIIQNHIDKCITDTDFNTHKSAYEHMKPELKESLYYRRIFDKYYKSHEKSISRFWLPKWCGNITDPSARVLNNYSRTNTSLPQSHT